MKGGHILVDLDKTLAFYDGDFGPGEIGDPILPMLRRVQGWIANGEDVRIFTARVAADPMGVERRAVESWCLEHLGRVLPVTNKKDYKTREIWDDRAIGVLPNSGIPVGVPRLV